MNQVNDMIDHSDIERRLAGVPDGEVAGRWGSCARPPRPSRVWSPRVRRCLRACAFYWPESGPLREKFGGAAACCQRAIASRRGDGHCVGGSRGR